MGPECRRCQGANVNVVGNWRMLVLGDLNEIAISLEEVLEAVNEMKSDRATWLDGFLLECLKKGGVAVLEWLVRQLNLSFDMGVVPVDWHGAWGDRCECGNSRGISLLSVVGGLFGGVLIEGVGVDAECAMGEEQCGFG